MIYSMIKQILSLYITSNQEYLLKQKGIEYNLFHPKDYDFNFYSDILYTSEKETLQYQERTIYFTKASLKGWEYAFDNIDETINIILEKYNTQNKTREQLLYEANTLKKLAYKKGIKLGNIDKTNIQRIYDIYHIMGLTKNKINIDKFIFNLNNNTHYLSDEEEKYLQNHKVIKML